MSSPPWKDVEAIFLEALDVPDDERAAWLLARCGSDDRMRSEIAALLASDQDATTVRPGSRSTLAGDGQPPRSPAQKATGEATGKMLLGRFEVQRELGRGGMGVVWLVRDPHLGRLVALKTFAAAPFADSDQRSRFVREARSIAQLKHPHLTQVFEAGELDGIPYYTMDYIEGRPLSGILRDIRHLGSDPDNLRCHDFTQALRSDMPAEAGAAQLHTSPTPSGEYCRRIVELMVEIAGALDHAHQRGVVHRDLKPANILVSTEGHGRLVDFGLAQVADEHSLTMTGDVLCTPSYASPEQIRGQDVDERTDQYSLGATLYEALTLQLPFTAETIPVLFYRILNREPVPPRRLNHAIDEDLQNICLKAMEKDAARRYPSMGAFADDLQRFLDGDTVLARPVGHATRAVRWTRRNPAAAFAIALVLLIVVGGPIGVSIYYHQLNVLVTAEQEQTQEQRNIAEKRRIQAQESLEESEQNFELAYAAVKTLLAEVGGERLLAEPGTYPLRHELLAKASETFDLLLADEKRGGDPRLLQDAVWLQKALGDLRLEMGQLEAAGEDYDRAVKLLGDLRGVEGDTPRVSYLLGSVHHSRGMLLERRGRASEASAAYTEGIQLLEALDLSVPNIVGTLTQSMINLGALETTYHLDPNSPHRAEALHRRAIELCEAAPELSVQVRLRLASAQTYLGGLLGLERDGRVEGRVLLTQAVRQYAELAAEGELEVPAFRGEQSHALVWLADIERQLGLPADAWEHIREAEELQSQLCSEFPEVVRFRFHLARCVQVQGNLEMAQRNKVEANLLLKRAHEMLGSLCDVEHPEPRQLMRLAEVQTDLGVLAYYSSDREGERREFEQALETYLRVRGPLRSSTWFRFSVATGHVNLGRALSRCNAGRESVEHLVRGTAALRAVVDEGEDSAEVWWRWIAAAGEAANMARVYGIDQEGEEEIDHAREALLTYSDLHETLPRERLAAVLFSGAQLTSHLRLSGRPGEAIRLATACIGWADEWPISELTPQEQSALARGKTWLGFSCKDLGRYAEAQEVLETALQLRERALERDPDSAYALHMLGAAHHNLAMNFQLQEDPQTARDHLDEAEAMQREVLERQPGNEVAREYLRNHLGALSVAKSALGEHENAIEQALGLASGRDGTTPDPPFAAKTLGELVTSIQDATLEPTEKAELAERATGACLSCLRQASLLEPIPEIEWDDSGFDAVRDLPEFQELRRAVQVDRR